MKIIPRPVRWTLLPLLLLANCTDTPVPFRVEHVGTLSQASYADFDRQAAAAPVRLKIRQAVPDRYPEPYWVFAFTAPFDPHQAPLQIGAFTGSGEIPARVASNLPAQLQQTLAGMQLFPAVTLSPTPHAFILSGTVTRADHENGPADVDAGTQIEAVVTRDGAALGSIQVNAIQVEFTPISPLAGLVMGMIQGSRSDFVSRKFVEVFTAAAQGARHGIGTSGLGNRFLYVPSVLPAPDVAAAAKQVAAAGPSCQSCMKE